MPPRSWVRKKLDQRFHQGSLGLVSRKPVLRADDHSHIAPANADSAPSVFVSSHAEDGCAPTTAKLRLFAAALMAAFRLKEVAPAVACSGWPAGEQRPHVMATGTLRLSAPRSPPFSAPLLRLHEWHTPCSRGNQVKNHHRTRTSPMHRDAASARHNKRKCNAHHRCHGAFEPLLSSVPEVPVRAILIPTVRITDRSSFLRLV